MTCVVRANVVDINFDSGQASDRIWVDTSVWIKVTYTRIKPAESAPYIGFISRVRKAGGQFFVGAVSFAEVGKVVESEELGIWLRTHHPGANAAVMLKTFRADPAERAKVVGEVTICWNQMCALAGLGPDAIQSSCVTTAAAGLAAGEFLDGPDAVILAEAKRNGVTHVLTHDRDFASARGVTILTANRRTIDEAKQLQLHMQR